VLIGYDTAVGNLAERVCILSEDSTGGRRFNSATDAEILNADVADSYFHRTMQILRARGLGRVRGACRGGEGTC
jgi:hypothetical protein